MRLKNTKKGGALVIGLPDSKISGIKANLLNNKKQLFLDYKENNISISLMPRLRLYKIIRSIKLAYFISEIICPFKGGHYFIILFNT